jgi:hypothetical protein
VFTIVSRRIHSRERRRLAQSVRRYSREECDRYHRAGVIQLGKLADRSALYERIAERLEQADHDPSEQGLHDLRLLLSEAPPVRDYGPRAGERNARIATILAELEEH